ncbi:MAG: hypothetical protein ACMXYE_05230 [Candidatus Woesearchaeota archaeon]
MKAETFFRDIRALGSWIIFIIVIARASIEMFRPFVDQMIIAGLLILVLSFLFEFDGYSARVVAAATFTSIFYMDLPFTLFVSFVGLAILYDSFKTYETRKAILGLIVGFIVTGIAYGIPFLYL